MTLRRLTPRWASAMQVLASEPRVSRHLAWHPHASVDDSLAFIRDTHRLWDAGAAFMFGIFLEQPLQLVGSTSISSIDRQNRRAEVGTWLGLPFQGQGLNREVKGAIFHVGFELLGLDRLELVVLAANEHSRQANLRLPGIVEEGLQHDRLRHDGVPRDAWMLAITRRSWDPGAYGSPTGSAVLS